MENPKDTRNIAVNMLTDTLEKGEFSHIVLGRTLEEENLSSRDRAFVNRLYAGTLENIVRIDTILDCISSVPVRKMKPVIRNILRMSAYQLMFMDSVPSHSCINEAVKLTRKRKMQGLTGFVNAVLRKLDKSYQEIVLPDYALASAPEWIYELVREQYGKETADQFFRAVRESAGRTCVRLNLLKGSKEEILGRLRSEGLELKENSDFNGSYELSGFDSLTDLRAFREGLIIMQDPSSMKAVQTAAEGIDCSDQDQKKLFVDVCAAPGGKSLYMAEMFPQATVISRDLTEKKAALIRQNCSRMGISNVEVQVHDALVYDDTLGGRADAVLADLPCSGLGVIGRKPDILYRLKAEDLKALQKLQQDILDTVQRYVKPGGVLLYSTCTINKEENEENACWFAENHDFTEEMRIQLIPGQDKCDGFFISRFRKN